MAHSRPVAQGFLLCACFVPKSVLAVLLTIDDTDVLRKELVEKDLRACVKSSYPTREPTRWLADGKRKGVRAQPRQLGAKTLSDLRTSQPARNHGARVALACNRLWAQS